MNEKELQHFGIPGMRWGQRKAQVSSGKSGGRRTAFGPTNEDGRKVNKLFGKRNRTAIKKYLFGDPDTILKNNIFLSRKYASMNPQEKERARKITQAVIYGSTALAAAQLVHLYRLNKSLGY